ncbi:Phage baseplate hub subunit (T4-like gp5) Phage tail lysozyme (T4-like gp5) [Paramuricea clavata]|uniref:Phage baseplate hub subunit (T4-like gp5) Phage tail lysozyme (T4-like gp5) n=1 Tax=Paramuricea clavata TaxID=317549 RepID=A0A6S7IA24_PARCT|nr:Phage baseplate hub subunit (T4-like gp5) Phage tail lysozyme (T4-like gp5) [Paramuricea clavata]
MAMGEIIAGFEGMRTSVYTDTRGLKTIGVGFNMEQANARQIFQRNVPDASFDDVLSGKASLTKAQANKLFQETLKDKVQETKRLFPNYDKYPHEVKTALVNGVFRGEYTSSQKTVKYINNGEWDKVAEEYLDRADYCASKPGRDGGIKKRMDYNADIFRGYAERLKK